MNVTLKSILLLSVGFSLNAVAEQATDITFKQVPSAVQTAILKQVKKADITRIERITDEGVIKYEFESSHHHISKDLTLAENGAVMEIEQSSSIKQLSPQAKMAIKHDYPNLTITEIETTQEFYTAIEGKVNGKKVAFKIQASGDIEDEKPEAAADQADHHN